LSGFGNAAMALAPQVPTSLKRHLCLQQLRGRKKQKVEHQFGAVPALTGMSRLAEHRFLCEGIAVVNIAQRLMERPSVVISRFLCSMILAAVLGLSAQAQTAAEYAGTTSASSAATATAKAPNIPAVPATGAPTASPHLTARSGPPPEENNRRELEEHAGKDASRLLLRSTLADSSVWIQGKPVGKTPMLLILAPGKYQVEVVAADSTRTECSVALLPRETRELTLKLEPHYRARVSVH
jgi:PEGA domain-containing protein